MSGYQFVASIVEHTAWPLVILGLAVNFRSKVDDLLPRITEIGSSGLKLSQPMQSTDESGDPEASEISTAKLLPLRDETAITIEAQNRKALEELPNDPKEREDTLLRALTVRQLERNFLLIYNGIFGSQIRALRALNGSPIARSEAEGLLVHLKAEQPAFESWTLDQYLGFLRHWRLVAEDGGKFFITETGRNFLLFLVQHGLSEDRPY